jgi:rSAM/selenodomain-associated transferase 1
MNKKSDSLLILFVKNLIPGHVKTRLAKEIGIDGALDVYQYLVEVTNEMAEDVYSDKAIFYSEYVEIEDIWDTETYMMQAQRGIDLGERMLNAFEWGFGKEYKKIVLIGTDCFDLKVTHIEEAFDELDRNNLVVGPAKDGGYYLIGLSKKMPAIFQNKKYSHDKVLNELLMEVATSDASFHLLETLLDIDTLQDLKDSSIEFEFVDPSDE